MMRRLGALVALIAMLVGPPLLLLWLGAYDWTGVTVAAPAGVRVIMLGLTVVGWVAWVLWVVAFAVELVAVVSRGRVRVRLPLLGAGQAWAATLLAAVTVLTPLASASTSPGTSASIAVAVAVSPATDVAARSATPDAEPEVTPASAFKASSSGATVLHAVVAGDDLWTLAQRYYGDGARWRSIVEANPDLAGDPLAELPDGAQLRIVTPVKPVTVRAGDSLWSLAELHLGDGRRWPEIHRLNVARVADPDLLRPGWVLQVPWQAEPLVSSSAGSPPGGSDAAVVQQADEGIDELDPAVGVARPAHVVPDAEAAATDADAAGPDAAAPAAFPAATPSQPDKQASPATVVAHPTDADAASSDVTAIAALVGGLASLTAGAVVAGLAVRRRLQEAARPLGRRYVQPGDDLRRLETALVLRSAPSGEPLATDRDSGLAKAMRCLSAHWVAAGVPAPILAEAVVGDIDVEFVFAGDVTEVPEGFQQRGRRVAVSWSRLRDLDDPAFPVAYPALVTLGVDPAGDQHHVDLLTFGVLGVAGERAVAAQALSAMLVELTCAGWASEIGLLVVTDDPRFTRAAASESALYTDSVEEGVALLEGLVKRRGRFLTAPDAYDSSRLDPNLAEAWSPQVVLFETPLPQAALERVRAAVSGPRCGVAAVLPVAASSGVVTWLLDAGAVTQGTLQGSDALGNTALVAQTVPSSTRDAIADLYDLAQATESHPAPWWATDDPKEPDVNIVTLRPALAPPGPLLRLLGPVTLEGASGPAPVRAPRQCMEYCAWLLEHPGATALQMASELLVAEGTRRSNMSHLRGWLGIDADGRPYLPDAYSGKIHLSDDVMSDWQQALELTVGGVNRASTERLTAVLDLVRGAPLADAAPGQWHWAEELRSDMVSLIRDVGVVLAARAREERDLDLARWAVNRALAAAPDDELLLGERLRVEYAAGRLDEVDRLARRMQRTARTLGIDLLPSTIDLLQELMEGRLRARRA